MLFQFCSLKLLLHTYVFHVRSENIILLSLGFKLQPLQKACEENEMRRKQSDVYNH